MPKNIIRVRFAPSPTGFMHLGNVRAALMNYIFSKHYNGSFILRIEDTDIQRNVDIGATNIINDLKWLGLEYDEGPGKPGENGPYYQSQRKNIYIHYLNNFIKENLVYRCFCSPEELELKRKAQLAQKQPPKYDRQCLKLSENQIIQNLENKVPFIWRFKLNYDKSVKFYDIAHKEMTFELKHFSDAALTRQDGSFTFIFANFVDDHKMNITHVLRGEDHLTNTAIQVALYNSINAEVPTFWHLPILINNEGKKLSKRDFGFSLTDLRQAGYLPEAICNYLGIIGSSFTEEILNLDELAHAYNFDSITATGQIKYDLEKLNWVNQKWIMKYPINKLTKLCKTYIENCFSEKIKENKIDISEKKLEFLIESIRPELINLENVCELLKFYFVEPEIDLKDLQKFDYLKYKEIFKEFLENYEKLSQESKALEFLKNLVKEKQAQLKPIFILIRLALTGKVSGLSIDELFKILDVSQVKKRLSKLT